MLAAQSRNSPASGSTTAIIQPSLSAKPSNTSKANSNTYRGGAVSINIGIIDQRLRKLAQDLAPEFETRLNIKNDAAKQRSTAFVFLVVKTILDIQDDEALDCLTEGGNDFGLDA